MPDDPQLELTPPTDPPASAAPADPPPPPTPPAVDPAVAALRAELEALRAQLQRPAPVAPPPAPAREEYSEEQLLELANAGNKEALRLYTERVSARQAQQSTAQQRAVEEFQRDYSETFAAHPELKDPTAPVTKKALEIQRDLIARGWPQNAVTELEAVKRAFLRTPLTPTAPREEPMPPGRTIEPSAVRRQPPPAPGPRKISPREAEIAARMGVKDPAKALENFAKRQESGRSQVGPTLTVMMREQA